MRTRLSTGPARASGSQFMRSGVGILFAGSGKSILFVNTFPDNILQPEKAGIMGQPLNGSLRNNVIHNFWWRPEETIPPKGWIGSEVSKMQVKRYKYPWNLHCKPVFKWITRRRAFDEEPIKPEDFRRWFRRQTMQVKRYKYLWNLHCKPVFKWNNTTNTANFRWRSNTTRLDRSWFWRWYWQCGNLFSNR